VNFFDQPTGSTTTVYSHFICGPPTFTIIDAGDIDLDSWITVNLVADTFNFTAKPTQYS
jgi:hypothetical protein